MDVETPGLQEDTEFWATVVGHCPPHDVRARVETLSGRAWTVRRCIRCGWTERRANPAITRALPDGHRAETGLPGSNPCPYCGAERGRRSRKCQACGRYR